MNTLTLDSWKVCYVVSKITDIASGQVFAIGGNDYHWPARPLRWDSQKMIWVSQFDGEYPTLIDAMRDQIQEAQEVTGLI